MPLEITAETLQAILQKQDNWSLGPRVFEYSNCGYTAIYSAVDWDILAKEINENYGPCLTEEEVMESFSDTMYDRKLKSWG